MGKTSVQHSPDHQECSSRGVEGRRKTGGSEGDKVEQD